MQSDEALAIHTLYRRIILVNIKPDGATLWQGVRLLLEGPVGRLPACDSSRHRARLQPFITASCRSETVVLPRRGALCNQPGCNDAELHEHAVAPGPGDIERCARRRLFSQLSSDTRRPHGRDRQALTDSRPRPRQCLPNGHYTA